MNSDNSLLKKSTSHFALIALLFLCIQTSYSQSTVYYKSDTAGYYTEPSNIDINIFRSINNYRSGFLDKAVTITDNSMIPAAIIIPGGMFLMGRAFENTYDENTGFLLGTSEILNGVMTFGIKFLVKRKRPYETLNRVYYKDVSIADPYSFPSGHSSMTFAISTMFALRYPTHPQIYVPLYLWSIIVGYGRVYFGMHYPSDVLAGAILGSLSSVTVYSLRNHILKFKNRTLGEEGEPDRNNFTAKSAGLIAGAYLVSIALNDLIFSDENKFQLLVTSNLISYKQTELRFTLRLN